MKNIFFFIGLFVAFNSIAQTKYYTKNGEIIFEASVPSFEEVKATNNTTTAILNIETGEIAALSLVKGFRFEIALMEEHFNESYAESNKFPKATFTGKVENFSFDALTNNTKLYTIKGALTFHGKTVDITIKVSITLKDNEILLTSEFTAKPEDFDIKLPKVIRKKVADTVVISIDFKLIPKN